MFGFSSKRTVLSEYPIIICVLEFLRAGCFEWACLCLSIYGNSFYYRELLDCVVTLLHFVSVMVSCNCGVMALHGCSAWKE